MENIKIINSIFIKLNELDYTIKNNNSNNNNNNNSNSDHYSDNTIIINGKIYAIDNYNIINTDIILSPNINDLSYKFNNTVLRIDITELDTQYINNMSFIGLHLKYYNLNRNKIWF